MMVIKVVRSVFDFVYLLEKNIFVAKTDVTQWRMLYHW